MQTVFTGLDHHRQDGLFATCGQQVDIWDEQRSSPIRSFTWGVDSFSSVNFNPVEVRYLKQNLSNRKLDKQIFVQFVDTTDNCLNLSVFWFLLHRLNFLLAAPQTEVSCCTT